MLDNSASKTVKKFEATADYLAIDSLESSGELERPRPQPYRISS